MADSPTILMGINQLASALSLLMPGVELISFCENTAAGFSSVSIDSRNVETGALFVALQGKRSDGHRYVESAFAKGAVVALVNRSALPKLVDTARRFQRTLLVVDDSLRGLQEAARAYLALFPQLIRIGITGSSGKTTTKELAAAMISAKKSVVMNEGNLNSETGLPLSVFKVRAWHKAGVFEMGMNRRGEIAELAHVLRPHIALITNIGTAHIGMLGSQAQIAREKKAIFAEFTGNETALLPAGDEYAAFLAEHVKGNVSFFGEQCFPELGQIRDCGLEGSEIEWDGQTARFRLLGAHNVKNVLAAAAIARQLPVSAASIRHGIESLTPLFGRSEILRGPITVIRDCYNANPESMAAAIQFCDRLEWQGRRVYVLGSMLELGGNSAGAHRRLGSILAESRANEVFLFGKEMELAAEALSGANPKVSFVHTDDINTLAGALARTVRAGDLVLLKGSRGCALERLTPVLQQG
ncbi:MAG: UDP-N-acetylmuramoyl-tripeptide--D-alanyl-D-alanine ligase [Treponema sp.]|nr:UDP-N-acetylmuramoyl-tripeptide--D-alanyl-D-alanine ligase [Treponema sp.]